MAGSLFVRSADQLEQLLRIFIPTALLLGLWAAAEYLGLLTSLNLTLAARSMALTAALAGCVFLAWFPDRLMLPLMGWAICIAVTVVTGSRMATLALLLLPALHPLYRSQLHRAAVVLASILLGLAIFYTPVFQRRFFWEGSGTLSDVWEGNFLSFGRFEAWPDIWEEAWRRPYLGHGVGTAYNFVPTVWEGMNFCHNDYLRIGFELGLVGVFLFVSVLVWQMSGLLKHINGSHGIVRAGFTASWLGFLVLAITAFTDNTLSYNLWFMNPLFAVMGASYGVSARSASASSPSNPQVVTLPGET
jgi:O-antigen ligase